MRALALMLSLWCAGTTAHMASPTGKLNASIDAATLNSLDATPGIRDSTLPPPSPASVLGRQTATALPWQDATMRTLATSRSTSKPTSDGPLALAHASGTDSTINLTATFGRLDRHVQACAYPNLVDNIIMPHMCSTLCVVPGDCIQDRSANAILPHSHLASEPEDDHFLHWLLHLRHKLVSEILYGQFAGTFFRCDRVLGHTARQIHARLLILHCAHCAAESHTFLHLLAHERR